MASIRHGGAGVLYPETSFSLKNHLIRRGGAPSGAAAFIVIGGMGHQPPSASIVVSPIQSDSVYRFTFPSRFFTM
jgi:hypothetical protein